MLDHSYQPAPRSGDSVCVRRDRVPQEAGDWAVLAIVRDNGSWRLVEEGGFAGSGEDLYEAARALLREDRRLLCCAGCCFLQLTGLTRDMSDGLSGYCLVYFPEHGRSAGDMVSIFDYCERFHACSRTPTDEVRRALWQQERGAHGGS